MDRLHGLQVNTLKLIASDEQLDELASIYTDFKALDLLLQLLDAAGEHPIPPW
ncbi:MAG: hypothetical protein WA071_29630 [Undibacterium umbellatum]|uniref:hypothetical protein n=1 Tax=Undibacterium umbellatum TaxID=2762300 RepID=UPI003BB536A3